MNTYIFLEICNKRPTIINFEWSRKTHTNYDLSVLCVPCEQRPLVLKFASSLKASDRGLLYADVSENRFLKLKITSVGSAYPGQRPQYPSLSSHFLLRESISRTPYFFFVPLTFLILFSTQNNVVQRLRQSDTNAYFYLHTENVIFLNYCYFVQTISVLCKETYKDSSSNQMDNDQTFIRSQFMSCYCLAKSIKQRVIVTFCPRKF